MAGDDAMADRQPQSGPLAHRLGCEKGIEKPSPMFGLDPRSVVGDRDRDPRAYVASVDLDLAPLLSSTALDGLQGIDQQIEQNLADLIGHAVDPRRVVNLHGNLD